MVPGEGKEQEDSLTEEDLKTIAKEQMETAANETGRFVFVPAITCSIHTHLFRLPGPEMVDKSQERLLLSEDCELITFMSVVKGKFELTTNYVYFFDSSPFRENEDRHDFR